MPGVDVRSLVARLGAAGTTLLQREVLAPLLLGGRIRTRVEGLVYEFQVEDGFVGWGRFRPRDERTATLVAEALPWERAAYLELFPALRALLLWPEGDAAQTGTWWALPYNESDARQRFGGDGADPLPVYLCDPTNGAQPFERVLARVDDRTCWFDGPDPLADPRQAEWLRDAVSAPDAPERFLPGLAASQRLALLFWQLHAINLEGSSPSELGGSPRAQQAAVRHLLRTRQLERELRRALAKADATLHSFQELPDDRGGPPRLVVEWSDQGRRYRYRSALEPDLTVVASGICLSGRDRDFDLTSLVGVVARSPFEGAGGDDDA